jgi:hypothetical protein
MAMNCSDPTDAQRRLAEAVRSECIRAAIEAHEDAGVRGLCQEGRWEAAIDAIRSLEIDRLLGESR